MVHGEVRPPLLDLANRELVESHLHAIWLACTNEPLDQSIAQLLVLDNPARPLRPNVRTPMEHPRVVADATARIRRVLDLLSGDLTSTEAPWYPGREVFATAVAEGALKRFEAAFDRWRNLLGAAEAQRDSARKVMDSYAAPQRDKDAARSRHAQALDQSRLLQQGNSRLSSDFYTYRYLATEGFLPGYNFPRLPLMAYVPATPTVAAAKPTSSALVSSRSRSSARASLVYHEGRAYKVVRALLSLSGQDSATPDAQLPTKIGPHLQLCGAGHVGAERSNCHGCGARSQKRRSSTTSSASRTWQPSRPSGSPPTRRNGSDRDSSSRPRSSGRHATRDRRASRAWRRTRAASGGRAGLRSGATITRINKGLRRRANKKTSVSASIRFQAGGQGTMMKSRRTKRSTRRGSATVDRPERGRPQERAADSTRGSRA